MGVAARDRPNLVERLGLGALADLVHADDARVRERGLRVEREAVGLARARSKGVSPSRRRGSGVRERGRTTRNERRRGMTRARNDADSGTRCVCVCRLSRRRETLMRTMTRTMTRAARRLARLAHRVGVVKRRVHLERRDAVVVHAHPHRVLRRVGSGNAV